jgi:hypothetical protein
MREWREQPAWFAITALFTGIAALLMSCVPTVAYLGMAPTISSEVVIQSVIERGLPILAVYAVAVAAAVTSSPERRPALAMMLLGAALPIGYVLMIYGLR